MAISSIGGMSAGFQGLTGVQKPQVQEQHLRLVVTLMGTMMVQQGAIK